MARFVRASAVGECWAILPASSRARSISRAAGEDGEVEAVSAQDVQQVLGLDSSAKVTLPKMDGFGDYTVTVTLHKQVKVELPLKLVEA